jgi:hypothetical protein
MIMSQGQRMPRIGILWRGDRRAESPLPAADRGLGPLFDAFARLPVVIEPVPYGDDAAAEVRGQLLGLDGVLVWVNPIQDGASRAVLDPLLREVSAAGVWVSAHPDVILQMGTKEVLYRTRHLGWGSDTSLYRSASRSGAAWSSSRPAATAGTASGESSCPAASQARPAPMRSCGCRTPARGMAQPSWCRSPRSCGGARSTSPGPAAWSTRPSRTGSPTG